MSLYIFVTKTKKQTNKTHIILDTPIIHTHHTQCPLVIITTKTLTIPCNTSYDTSFITRFHLFIITSPRVLGNTHKHTILFSKMRCTNKSPLPPLFSLFFQRQPLKVRVAVTVRHGVYKPLEVVLQYPVTSPLCNHSFTHFSN